MRNKPFTMKPQKAFAAVNVEAKYPWADTTSVSWSARNARERFISDTNITWDEWKKQGWRIRRVLVIADDGR